MSDTPKPTLFAPFHEFTPPVSHGPPPGISKEVWEESLHKSQERMRCYMEYDQMDDDPTPEIRGLGYSDDVSPALLAHSVAREAMIAFAELRKGIERLQNIPKGDHGARVSALVRLREEAERECQRFKRWAKGG